MSIYPQYTIAKLPLHGKVNIICQCHFHVKTNMKLKHKCIVSLYLISFYITYSAQIILLTLGYEVSNSNTEVKNAFMHGARIVITRI